MSEGFILNMKDVFVRNITVSDFLVKEVLDASQPSPTTGYGLDLTTDSQI